MDHRNAQIDMRLHINSSAVNVRGYYDKPVPPKAFFNQTSAPVLSTCNNVNCHFRKTTDIWGFAPLAVGQSEASCSYCHAATSMNTGNHTKHITMLGNTITTCATCHVDRATFSHATTAKAGKSIGVAISNTPLAGAPVYNAGTHASYPNYFTATGYGNCNNVYCHSSAQAANGSGAGTYQQVTWNSAALTCSGCHGSTTANLNTGTHSKHLNGYGYLCSDCHGAGYDASTNSVVAATHVNKLINVNLTNKGQGNTPVYGGDATPQNGGFGTCNNTICHGKNSGTWGTNVSTNLCTECHGQANVAFTNFSAATIAPGGAGVDTGGNTAATSPRVGTHQTHLLGQSNISSPMHCGECHTTHVAINDSTHLNYTTSTVLIKGPLGTAYGKVPTAVRASGLVNCSNVACHVGKRPAGTAAGQSGASAYPVAVWNNDVLLGGTSIADTCNAKCHNMPPGGGLATDVHKDLAGGNAYTTFGGVATACGGCHGAVLDIANTAPGTYAGIFKDKSKHINGNVDANGHAFPYPGSLHFNDTGATSPFGGCSGCHNVATTGSYVYPSAAGAAPACMGCHKLALNSTLTTTSCQDCHGTNNAIGRPNDNVYPNYSGAHTTHNTVKGFACGTCHANGGSGSANHGSSNRIASTNVTFVHVSSTPTYPFHWSGTATSGNCSAAYCHSSGQAANGGAGAPSYKVVTWNAAALACSGCHGDSVTDLLSGSHTKHLSISTNCGNCHTGATLTSYPGVSHVNKLIDVATGVTYSLAGAPGNGFGACTTASCHSNGKAVYQPATWGGSSLTCDSCHPLASLGGAHQRHMGALTIAQVKFYNYTANKSAGQDTTTQQNYAFGCANCHPLVLTSHYNGTVEVELNNTANDSVIRSKSTTATVNGVVGTNVVTCSNVYCHSNGQGGNTTTLAWNQTYSAVDRCAQCHGNSPTSTGAHVAHAVGIHSDDVFSGGIGKLAAGNTGNVAHGITTQATTINCDTCHWSSVTYARNRNNSTCSTVGCHPTGTDTATTQVARVMLASHVNGTVEVAFRPVNIVSKAQLRPASFNNITAGTAGWGRSTYKSGVTSYDTAKTRLDIAAVYSAGAAGAGTCSNIVCHNMKVGETVTWNSSLTCLGCHDKL
jgi:predicted CxxxxCH...CXXCH cytochrome family protein